MKFKELMLTSGKKVFVNFNGLIFYFRIVQVNLLPNGDFTLILKSEDNHLSITTDIHGKLGRK